MGYLRSASSQYWRSSPMLISSRMSSRVPLIRVRVGVRARIRGRVRVRIRVGTRGQG